MAGKRREIAPLGTATRVTGAMALLYVAGGATLASWRVELQEAAIGLIALPALTVALGLVAQRYARGSIQFTGPLGLAVNAAVIAGLFLNDYTGPEGAAIFYATTMLIAAWRGQQGCEVTAISNWILGRKDQIGCPPFTPIDELEAQRRRQAAMG